MVSEARSRYHDDQSTLNADVIINSEQFPKLAEVFNVSNCNARCDMPLLTRWTIKTAMIYLVAGLAAGVLYWANVQWMFAPVFAALSPTYLHMLVVGWLTQLIFGVIYWMFPIIRRDNMRGDPRLAWAVFGLLNTGLVLRIICEPWRAISPNDVNGIGLVLSALLQVGAGYLFIVVCWPRVRERAGTGSA